MDTIILASGSPRRRELMQKARLPFRTATPNIDEQALIASSADKAVREIARKKVEAIIPQCKPDSSGWILAADTLVELDGKILGKPDGMEQARDFIRELAGKVHRVHTGLALYPGKVRKIKTVLATTEVKFRSMNRDEIEFYIHSGEWMGAAGAYRIQEQGGFFIDWVKGSYSNVIGLPIESLYLLLKQNGYCFTNP